MELARQDLTRVFEPRGGEHASSSRDRNRRARREVAAGGVGLGSRDGWSRGAICGHVEPDAPPPRDTTLLRFGAAAFRRAL